MTTKIEIIKDDNRIYLVTASGVYDYYIWHEELPTDAVKQIEKDFGIRREDE
jgi:hypothetical protein